MKERANFRRSLFVLSFLLASGLAACHSYHIDTTIENRTGGAIQLLEVDYPSASFGTDRLPEGEAFHYRFQVRGSGPLTITYTDSGGHHIHYTGPSLVEGQQGQLEITLLPGGKAELYPKLSPPMQPSGKN